MIRSFKDDDAKLLWENGKSRRIPASIRKVALKKLLVLHWATNLGDLAVPGGNRLEALAGDRKGKYSIRINDQYRLCFVWRETDAHEVEIVDYH
ncbi:MAG: type II toxin-antitoxin system RelE/ParE family toxin [Terracidiphilus sp.]